MILIQAVRKAMVNDLVVRNVADLANVPTGKPGRPSRSLDLERTLALLDAAKGKRLWPHVAVSVSLLPDSGVPIEQIADAVGHASTRTTEVVYRHQLGPVTRTAAIALGPLFEDKGKSNGGQS
jgi:hypothetical protein